MGALLFGEPDGVAVAQRLRGAALIAPALLPFALANVCLKKMRRHPDRRDALVVAFGMLDQMAVGFALVDPVGALVLAERSGLTADDASYLWLARWGAPNWSRSTGNWKRSGQRLRERRRQSGGREPLRR